MHKKVSSDNSLLLFIFRYVKPSYRFRFVLTRFTTDSGTQCKNTLDFSNFLILEIEKLPFNLNFGNIMIITKKRILLMIANYEQV